ncbi:MAG: hypothetical protein J6K62_06275 [Clostridia bacterium]|nr:hypothetical protein [Clostridia bacterium]
MMNKKTHRRIRARLSDTVANSVHAMVEQGRGEVLSDILGSYTGNAQDGEAPEQDADDL